MYFVLRLSIYSRKWKFQKQKIYFVRLVPWCLCLINALTNCDCHVEEQRTDKTLKNSKELCKHKIISLALCQPYTLAFVYSCLHGNPGWGVQIKSKHRNSISYFHIANLHRNYMLHCSSFLCRKFPMLCGSFVKRCQSTKKEHLISSM